MDEIHYFEYQMGIDCQEQRAQENLLTRNNYAPSKPVKFTGPPIGTVELNTKTMIIKSSLLEKGVKK